MSTFLIEFATVVCFFGILIGCVTFSQECGASSSANTMINNSSKCININGYLCFYPIHELPLTLTRDSSLGWNALAFSCAESAEKKWTDSKVYISFNSQKIAIQRENSYAIVNPLEKLVTTETMDDKGNSVVKQECRL